MHARRGRAQRGTNGRGLLIRSSHRSENSTLALDTDQVQAARAVLRRPRSLCERTARPARRPALHCTQSQPALPSAWPPSARVQPNPSTTAS